MVSQVNLLGDTIFLCIANLLLAQKNNRLEKSEFQGLLNYRTIDAFVTYKQRIQTVRMFGYPKGPLYDFKLIFVYIGQSFN